MFVCTVKASSIKFFTAILFSAAVLVGIVAIVPVIDSSGETAVAALEYKGVNTVEEQLSFLNALGYDVDPSPVFSDEVIIPEMFDSVYEKYNDLQKSQGLNLEKYKGKTVMRYTYAIGGDTESFATLLIYKNRIIGGDITTLGENGGIDGLEKETRAESPENAVAAESASDAVETISEGAN